jgi:ElaB/YqjD/DUF883 family membrane-anchored ribosome-binding protein
MSSMKDNVIPLALLGAGLLLLARNVGSAEEEVFDTYDSEAFGEHGDHEHGGGRLSQARDRVSDAASHLADRASGPLHNARMGGMEMVSDSPFLAGVAAVALGALIGALIPETEKEHQLLGQKRDELAERARGLAQQGVDRAKDAVSNATDAARQAAQDAVKNAVKNVMGGGKNDVAQDMGSNARA